MKIYGLIGLSLRHSFSRRFFSDKFKREDITDSEYQNFEIKNPDEEVVALKRNPDVRGLNVTIPYKSAIILFLDELTDECREVNACNCIKIKDGKWIGYNTDIIGFEKTFVPHLKTYHRKALILGTGGASNAVAFVLKKLNIDFLKVSRKRENVHGIINYEQVSRELLKDYNIVINASPVGMFPRMDEYPPLPYEAVTPKHYFFDLIYNPAKTLFLSLAEEYGAFIENGDKMLSIQAEESWDIWNV
ncbi:MAG: shikimate dehydrogenase [Ginsengibacter sp.]